MCASFKLLMYYSWSSCIWDFLPLWLIFWFHYKNFKPRDDEQLSDESAKKAKEQERQNLLD